MLDFHCLKSIDDQDRIPWFLKTTKACRIFSSAFDFTVMLSPTSKKIIGHSHIALIFTFQDIYKIHTTTYYDIHSI